MFANVTNDMTIAREEIFGPVLCILGYDDVDQAVEIANDTEYGLAGYVSASDLDTARAVARRIRAGSVAINHGFDMNAPFGGYKRSGNGREWGEFALRRVPGDQGGAGLRAGVVLLGREQRGDGLGGDAVPRGGTVHHEVTGLRHPDPVGGDAPRLCPCGLAPGRLGIGPGVRAAVERDQTGVGADEVRVVGGPPGCERDNTDHLGARREMGRDPAAHGMADQHHPDRRSRRGTECIE